MLLATITTDVPPLRLPEGSTASPTRAENANAGWYFAAFATPGEVTLGASLSELADLRANAVTQSDLLAWGRAIPRTGLTKLDLDL